MLSKTIIRKRETDETAEVVVRQNPGELEPQSPLKNPAGGKVEP